MAYNRTSSWAVAVFVFLNASLVGGWLGDAVARRSNKVESFLWAIIPPATATALLYLSHLWWNRWGLAALVGLVFLAFTYLYRVGTITQAEEAANRAEDVAGRYAERARRPAASGQQGVQYRVGMTIRCQKCSREIKIKDPLAGAQGQVAFGAPRGIDKVALRCEKCGYITCWKCSTAAGEGLNICPSCQQSVPLLFTDWLKSVR
jgi:hypothetical protein